jgi:hypothetical protein
MNKSEIITHLNIAHSEFWDTAMHLPNAYASQNGKWSVAQNVDHINIVLSRLCNYLGLPKSTIKSNFGLSVRVSLGKEEFIKTYLKELANGAKASAPFIPHLSPEISIDELVTIGKDLLDKFVSNLENWSEEELEIYNCMHPILGKIPVREVLYFTIYHVQHHNETIKKK